MTPQNPEKQATGNRRQATGKPEIPIASVTVLEDRAAVTRRGTIAVAAGQQRIVIEGVSPVLADKTLTCTATNARVLDARVERYVAPWRSGEGDVGALRGEREALEARRADAEARAHAARNAAAAQADAIAATWNELAVAATRGTPLDAGAIEKWFASLQPSDGTAAELELEELTAALARLDNRVATAEQRAGDDAARIVIDVVAEAAGEATLTCGYVVPGAAWRPYHRAVLRGEVVDVHTMACVWQATGEDWRDCELIFSLERASLGVEPPDFDDDVLRTRRRPEQVHVEAREQEQQTVGLGASEVPGIDDGGLGLVLRGKQRATIAADGAPHRVALASFTSAVHLSRVAIPLRSPWVHLRARLANTGTTPLLAGPVDLVMSSGYVGRAEVGFVAPGEKLDLGFGPDADLRVHRSETRAQEEAGLLGGWNTQTVRVAVRLSNLGASKREITITERVPVSEVEQVEVQASAAESYLLAGEDQVTPRTLDGKGLVTWTVELPPFSRRAVALEYKIKSQRRVAGATSPAARDD